MAATIETLISDELRSWIGRSSRRLPLPEAVSASDIRRYVDATEDRNPLWLDDDAARAAGYKGRVVPPMLVLELTRRAQDESGEGADWWHKLPLPPDYTDTRNAGGELEWLAPVYVGDRLALESSIVDIVARQGRAGLGIYVTREERVLNQGGEVVLKRRQMLARFPKKEYKDG
ncbi:MAG TPA: MaoC family dehydratase [Candidatus Binatia bacterium]|jgi:acyl dehydratase